jgi:hypothetical protein
VWKRTAKGLTFTFHLAGINNQNFLMRDDQTGSFWQQISGRAISGPLAGTQLDPVRSDELTFALWRREYPGGTVLKPVRKFAGDYESKNWETRMVRAPTVVTVDSLGPKARELVLGVEAFGASRAYPVSRILSEKLIQDQIGSEPVLVAVAPDGKSIRVFHARLKEGEPAPDFYRRTDISAVATATAELPIFFDSVTLSEWNFNGCAVSGRMTGACLAEVRAIKDYWFDWQTYHPQTSLFGKRIGPRK